MARLDPSRELDWRLDLAAMVEAAGAGDTSCFVDLLITADPDRVRLIALAAVNELAGTLEVVSREFGGDAVTAWVATYRSRAVTAYTEATT